MLPRDREYLKHILLSARLAVSYISPTNWRYFISDIQLQDSVIRRLDIISEAERRLSEGTRISLSHIPLIMMRNKLIQEYDKVVLEVVWETVSQDLPLLISELEKVFPEETEEKEANHF